MPLLHPDAQSPAIGAPTNTRSSAPIQLSRVDIGWLTVVCGFAVATLYYNQPMLPLMGHTFDRDASQVGWVATLTQIGYAVGLVLFAPLGDRFDRRRLLTSLLTLNIAALLLCGGALTFPWLLTASGLVGVTSITAQVVIPAVSGMTDPSRRGKTVGTLLSGLFAGALLARTLSGFVGEHLGWRLMYVLAAVFDLILLALVVWKLPRVAPTSTLAWSRLVASMWLLVRTEPLLREAAATGFLMFAAFNALWGSLASLLAEPPFHFGADVTGLFGLIGVVGMVASPTIGSMTDRFGGRVVGAFGAAVITIAFAAISAAASTVWILLVGVVLLDLGSRSGLVANQTRLGALDPEARSRLNTVFMGCYFAGGALGSAMGAAAGSRHGWPAVASVGAIFSLAALGTFIYNSRSSPKLS